MTSFGYYFEATFKAGTRVTSCVTVLQLNYKAQKDS